MRIVDYKPKLYNTNAEMTTLYEAMDDEFEVHIKHDIDEVYKNTFIETADERGIENFEALFNIVSTSDETLQFRKERLLYRMNSQLPYTYRYLQMKLDEILGQDNYEMTLTYSTYHLLIQLVVPGRSWYNELINMLQTVLPCNIAYEIEIYKASWNQVNETYTTWNDITSMDWQDVLDGEWISD